MKYKVYHFAKFDFNQHPRDCDPYLSSYPWMRNVFARLRYIILKLNVEIKFGKKMPLETHLRHFVSTYRTHRNVFGSFLCFLLGRQVLFKNPVLNDSQLLPGDLFEDLVK